MLTRTQALQVILEQLTDQLVIHCNGYIGRESFILKDRPQNFYMIGSMGLASSIGLGLALSQPRRKILILDGDGNVLMNLGTLSTIGAFKPNNLIHLVLDNGVYGSTGNQPTLSSKVDLARIAGAAGYPSVESPADEKMLSRQLDRALKKEGPHFLHIRIDSTADDHGIGRVTHTPEEMTRRLRSAVLQSSP